MRAEDSREAGGRDSYSISMPCTAYWHGVAFLQLATRDMHACSVAYWRAVGCSCVHFQRRVLLNLSFSGIERLMHLLCSFLAVPLPTLPTEARVRVEKTACTRYSKLRPSFTHGGVQLGRCGAFSKTFSDGSLE